MKCVLNKKIIYQGLKADIFTNAYGPRVAPSLPDPSSPLMASLTKIPVIYPFPISSRGIIVLQLYFTGWQHVFVVEKVIYKSEHI